MACCRDTLETVDAVIKVAELPDRMVPYVCLVCGYIYEPEKGDPKAGIAPGTEFEALPDDWVCLECGAGKDQFVKVQV